MIHYHRNAWCAVPARQDEPPQQDHHAEVNGERTAASVLTPGRAPLGCPRSTAALTPLPWTRCLKGGCAGCSPGTSSVRHSSPGWTCRRGRGAKTDVPPGPASWHGTQPSHMYPGFLQGAVDDLLRAERPRPDRHGTWSCGARKVQGSDRRIDTHPFTRHASAHPPA